VKAAKENFEVLYLYRISAPDRNYDKVEDFLIMHNDVKSFDV
jgi:hypothetical protein